MDTVPHRRPGRFALVGGIALSLGIAGMAAAWVGGPGRPADAAHRVEIAIHYSHFSPADVDVAGGVPATFVMLTDDPMAHEWIAGDAGLHERHRTGTEPTHASRPTEISIPAH